MYRKSNKVLVLTHLLTIFFVNCYSEIIKVKTSEGIVVGEKANDGNYYSLYGIPYGGKTSGEYRFKAALEPSKYDVHIADKKDTICAQPSPDGLLGVEDCLTLNIFTSNLTSSKDVIVWLYGEDYSNTRTPLEYSYKAYAQSDIVFVEVNYRLSIFGYLCLRDEEAPGNAGIKDVIQALKWIKKNIKPFGGNPDNVTLFGYGSGAAMVDLITMSPMSKNLVHKGIAIGGSALSPWAVAYDPVGYAKALAYKLNIDDTDLKSLAKTLQKVNASSLVQAINSFKFINQTLLFAPCIEDVKEDSVLTTAPLATLRSGNYDKIPYFAGHVSDEGIIAIENIFNDRWLERLQENFSDFLPADLAFENKENKDNISQYIRTSYFGNDVINRSSIADLLEYEADTLTKFPVMRYARERAIKSDNAVHLFIFDIKESSSDDWINENITSDKLRRGKILDYIFYSDFRKSNQASQQSFLNRIIAFVKTGIPEANDDEAGDIIWDSISSQNFNYLYMRAIKINFLQEARVNPQLRIPWDDIYNEYYRAPSSGSNFHNFLSKMLMILAALLLFLT